MNLANYLESPLKSVIETRFSHLPESDMRNALHGRKVGLEKESLRVDRDGLIVQSRHPRGLGSALTHPSITTDYSEALLELVTPPFERFSETLQYLDETHRFVYSQLDNEILWATSMPCVIDGDTSIRIAEYGSSNAAKMKSAYRRGLGHRYGRMMQAIAGVHFNYSYPQEFWQLYRSMRDDSREIGVFSSDCYMGMLRNLQRYGWLIPYLFGSSPAICGSFLGATPTNLERLFEHSYFGKYATSLRVGDIGYQNNKEDEAGIRVNYDSLQSYVESLGRAIATPCAEYEKIELVKDGVWQQLNTNILQIENEFYSSVRPKQILQGEEKPTLALAKRGVAYIELRSLDVNVYEPLGINDEQMRFLESFLLLNLLLPSDPYTDSELDAIKYNINAVAERGRDPALKLRKGGGEVLLRDWAREIFEQMSITCDLLDKDDASVYCATLQQQKAKIEEPELTPSARILTEMIENKEEFSEFSLRMSMQHQQWFADRPLEAERQKQLERMASESIERQRDIENNDDLPFEQFLQNYFDQT